MRQIVAVLYKFRLSFVIIQGVAGGDVSIGYSKQNSVYVHVSYSERFPR
jgi:hypothetical protein